MGKAVCQKVVQATKECKSYQTCKFMANKMMAGPVSLVLREFGQ